MEAGLLGTKNKLKGGLEISNLTEVVRMGAVPLSRKYNMNKGSSCHVAHSLTQDETFNLALSLLILIFLVNFPTYK